jgi:hypothetical protein
MTLGSHQKTVGASQEYITPKWIIDRLGPFDLDPCAAKNPPWLCARMAYFERGLEQPWDGCRVFLNPPFDRYQVGKWIARLAEHGHGTALLHARTETDWFRPIWECASAILFMFGRIKFCDVQGVEQPANSGAPPVLVAFGAYDAYRLADSGIEGALVTNHRIVKPLAESAR